MQKNPKHVNRFENENYIIFIEMWGCCDIGLIVKYSLL